MSVLEGEGVRSCGMDMEVLERACEGYSVCGMGGVWGCQEECVRITKCVGMGSVWKLLCESYVMIVVCTDLVLCARELKGL